MPQIKTPPQQSMFRTSVVKGGENRVDRDTNVIFGANLMQSGDLNEGDSRPWTIDSKTLSQALALMQQRNNGTKGRYTHPNMSSDGMGSHLGRWKDHRIDGDRIRADLHIADVAFKSPQGDLGTYVMDLADEDPEAFGVSLATRLDWEDLERHEEHHREQRRLARREDKPEPETPKWPMRFAQIKAADVVDDPAATRGGLFDTSSHDLRQLPAQATLLLDSYFADATPDVVSARVNGFLTTYFQNKGIAMADQLSSNELKPGEILHIASSESIVIPDIATEKKTAADLARKEERDRITTINALCVQAKRPDLAADYCEKGMSVPEVNASLLQVLCKSNKPVGDEGGSDDPEHADENAKYKAEFKAEKLYAKSMTEADYVAMRRVDDGVDVLKSSMSAAAK